MTIEKRLFSFWLRSIENWAVMQFKNHWISFRNWQRKDTSCKRVSRKRMLSWRKRIATKLQSSNGQWLESYSTGCSLMRSLIPPYRSSSKCLLLTSRKWSVWDNSDSARFGPSVQDSKDTKAANPTLLLRSCMKNTFSVDHSMRMEVEQVCALNLCLIRGHSTSRWWMHSLWLWFYCKVKYLAQLATLSMLLKPMEVWIWSCSWVNWRLNQLPMYSITTKLERS